MTKKSKPMSARRRAQLRASIVLAMSDAVRERIVPDDAGVVIDEWEDEHDVWKGQEVVDETRAIWDRFLAWRRRTWLEKTRPQTSSGGKDE